MSNYGITGATAVLSILLFAGPVVRGQTNLPDKPGETPRVLPDGCSAVLVEEMRSLQGTDGYRFLRRELEAFHLGHTGRQQISAAMVKMPQATRLHRLAVLKTEMNDAQNSFLCSSFLIGRQSYASEDYVSVNKVLTSEFNLLALGAWKMQNGMTQIYTDETLSPAETADIIAFAHEYRRSTSTDILDVAKLSGWLIIDTSDAHATKVRRVTISCKERQALLAKLAPLANDKDKDEFTEAAELLEVPLQMPYKCAQ